MEFKFSRKEELLQWAVNDFAQRELAPNKIETLDYVPREIVRKIGELGFLGLKLPEQYGGKAGTWVMVGLLEEEIAKASIAMAYLIMLSYEVSHILAQYGLEEAKGEWLSGLVRGEKLGCISVAESEAGSNVGAMKARAVREGDEYVLRGEKGPISFGIQADMGILFMKTDSGVGLKGVTAFLVPLAYSGITKIPIRNMGLFPSASYLFELRGVRVPLKFRVGEEGDGNEINKSMGFLSEYHQVMSGLISLGLAQTALRLAVGYSKERVAFGRPIGQFEAISGKIAEDATLIEAGRWLCYRALWLKDQGLPCGKEAAMCGWWCPKISYRVIENALLIHGHSGYSDDLPFQQMLRDVTAFEIIGGTEQILKLSIAQQVIGRVAVPKEIAEEIAV